MGLGTAAGYAAAGQTTKAQMIIKWMGVLGEFAVGFLPIINILMDLKSTLELLDKAFENIAEGIFDPSGSYSKAAFGFGLLAVALFAGVTGLSSEFKFLAGNAVGDLIEKGAHYGSRATTVAIRGRTVSLASGWPSYRELSNAVRGFKNGNGEYLEVHHILPRYLWPEGWHSYVDDSPGLIATIAEHDDIHRVISRYLPQGFIYDIDDVQYGLRMAYGELNLEELYWSIHPWIMEMRRIEKSR